MLAARVGIGARVPVERLAREHVGADAADPRRRAGEVPLDERRLEPDRLEDLRAAVGRDRRDAHLRNRLQQRLGDALDRARTAASSAVIPSGSQPVVDELASVSSITYGLTAAAP